MYRNTSVIKLDIVVPLSREKPQHIQKIMWLGLHRPTWTFQLYC